MDELDRAARKDLVAIERLVWPAINHFTLGIGASRNVVTSGSGSSVWVGLVSGGVRHLGSFRIESSAALHRGVPGGPIPLRLI